MKSIKKTYTVAISGRGAEVYCYKLTPETKKELDKIAVKGIIKEDSDTTAEIVGVEDLFMEDEVDDYFEGADSYTIDIAACAADDFYEVKKYLYQIKDVKSKDIKYAYDGDYLFAVNNVKGTFALFELKLDSDIDISKISGLKVDINSQMHLLTDIYYDGKKLERCDGYDTSSSSTTLLLKNKKK